MRPWTIWRSHLQRLWHRRPGVKSTQPLLTGLWAQVVIEVLIYRAVDLALALPSRGGMKVSVYWIRGRLRIEFRLVDFRRRWTQAIARHVVHLFSGKGIRHMASAHDVAAYILKRQGEMSSMKLQKLVYYSQAWHLVWDEEPLFPERIEAWANGPVCRDLYEDHRGLFSVERWPAGRIGNLTEKQKASIDAVLGAYGNRPGAWLSELSHMEPPWLDAREGLPPGARGSQEITSAAMAEYYGGLVSTGQPLT